MTSDLSVGGGLAGPLLLALLLAALLYWRYDMRNRWSPTDRQAFADGNRNRAHTQPTLKFEGPTADEWEPEDLTLVEVDFNDYMNNAALGVGLPRLTLHADKTIADIIEPDGSQCSVCERLVGEVIHDGIERPCSSWEYVWYHPLTLELFCEDCASEKENW